jgi:hypothetical protein
MNKEQAKSMPLSQKLLLGNTPRARVMFEKIHFSLLVLFLGVMSYLFELITK